MNELKSRKDELVSLLNDLLDNNDFDDDIIGKILDELDAIDVQLDYGNAQEQGGVSSVDDTFLELDQSNQVRKVDDRALYLHDDEIVKIYKNNGGKEDTILCAGIEGEVGLEGVFYNFVASDEKAKVCFVMENDHWIAVRLEKTKDGITYQVADSLQGDGADIRSQKIDELFAYDGIERIPFKSEIQQNGYDCGICAALNAIDMNGGDVEAGLTSVKSTFSHCDVEGVRNTVMKERGEKKVDDIWAKHTQEVIEKTKNDVGFNSEEQVGMDLQNLVNVGDANISINEFDKEIIVQQQKALDYWKNKQIVQENQVGSKQR